MPNHYLHPTEIKKFFALYDKFSDANYPRDNHAEVKEFQTLIQKIDYERSPYVDDFKLVEDGNSYEESFHKGVDGVFGDNTVTAANAAQKWLNSAIKSGEISMKTVETNPELRKSEAFAPSHGFGKDHMLVNLNQMLGRAQLSEDGTAWLTRAKIVHFDYDQQVTKVDIYFRKGDYGKSFFKLYTNTLDEFKNNENVKSLLAKEDWNKSDRESWESILLNTMKKNFNNDPFYDGTDEGPAKNHLNLLQQDDYFACHERSITSGLALQLVENQLLPKDGNFFKSPTSFYRVSLDAVREGYEYGGNHAVVISAKTGNVLSNGTQVVNSNASFQNFADGVPIVVSDTEFYINTGFSHSYNNTYTTRDKLNDDPIHDKRPREMYDQFINDRQTFDKNVAEITQEVEALRECFIEEAVKDAHSESWLGVADTNIMDASELKNLAKKLGDRLLDVGLEVINNVGTENDFIKVNGGSPLPVNFSNDSINQNTLIR